MVDNVEILGGILAGGLSRRMGGVEKSQMDLAGQSLINRVTERLQRQIEHLVINANGDASRFQPTPHPIVSDIVVDHAGPLAGIHAMLNFAKASKTNYTHIASIAADTPFFPTDFVARCVDELLTQQKSDSTYEAIIIAKSGGFRHPVFGLWPISILASLDEFLRHGDTRKVMAFVQKHTCLYVEFEIEDIAGVAVDPFLNINTPLELEKACDIISLMKSGGEL